MIPAELIVKKRDGGRHSDQELAFLIDGYVAGDIPDYQMAAWCMAVFFRGMSDAETRTLTDRMMSSGQQLKRHASDAPRVDKHSTGGLGDKTSLILAPLLACCELHVPMLSGRGLGITGGTLDKLEAIPGLRTDLSLSEIDRQLERIGVVITGTTPELVPADARLYQLRDVTGTVASLPLITASIMSKKLVESLDALVLDVKFGSGAFMPDIPAARRLAQALVRTGQAFGLATTALITDMNQPLGAMVGNSLEVNEVLQVLDGGGPPSVRQLSVELAARPLLATGHCSSLEQARERAASVLDSGQARQRFEHMVAEQGGRLDGPLPAAPRYPVTASRAGWLTAWNCQRLGQAVIELGGGRRRAGEPIDHRVGLEVLVQPYSQVEVGQPLLNVYATHSPETPWLESLRDAAQIGDQPPPVGRTPLIAEEIL
jgi:pyrimidine-nucleoside phosphorylase